MAHGFLESFDNRYEVFSAGTKAEGRVNPYAIEVMKDLGIDISKNTSDQVDIYINDEWDYVITVCGGANETCPAFTGKVKKRLHIGFDDPSDAVGSKDCILSEYFRVRDEIFREFKRFYAEELAPKLP